MRISTSMRWLVVALSAAMLLAVVAACGAETVEVPGATLRQGIDNLDAEYPGIKALIGEDGRVRPGLQLAVDGVLSATGLMGKVPEGSEVHILPARGGG